MNNTSELTFIDLEESSDSEFYIKSKFTLRESVNNETYSKALLGFLENEYERQMMDATKYLNSICKYFDEKKWPYTLVKPSDNYEFLLVGFRSKKCTILLKLEICDVLEFVVINFEFMECQKDSILVINEYLNTLNTLRLLGYFHVDQVTGIIKYKHTFHYNDFHLDDDFFIEFINESLYIIDRNYDNLFRVGNGKLDEKEKFEFLKKIQRSLYLLFKKEE